MNPDGRSDNLRDLFRWIEDSILPMLPNKRLRERVQHELSLLKDLFETRPPRLMIVGRRGAGKSSLINAILRQPVAAVGSTKGCTLKPRWYDYKDERGEIAILDTRGLGDLSSPNAESKATAEDLLKTAITEKMPDAILFLCKAKEVDARIGEDLDGLVRVKAYADKRSGGDLPVIGVATQVDELDPPDISTPPFDDPCKQSNIQSAKTALASALSGRLGCPTEAIPVCAYMRFANGSIVHDRSWNIDTLLDLLLRNLPGGAGIMLGRLCYVQAIQVKLARRVVVVSAGLAGVVGAEPLPIADMPVITGIQLVMVALIGFISGRDLKAKTALEFFTAAGINVAAAMAFRELARNVAKLLPVGGSVIGGAVAAAGTRGLGEAAIAYFVSGTPPVLEPPAADSGVVPPQGDPRVPFFRKLRKRFHGVRVGFKRAWAVMRPKRR